jgi:hypothetical protein
MSEGKDLRSSIVWFAWKMLKPEIFYLQVKCNSGNGKTIKPRLESRFSFGRFYSKMVKEYEGFWNQSCLKNFDNTWVDIKANWINEKIIKVIRIDK